MVDAIAPVIDAGRVKLYCVDSYDSQSWQAQHLPLEERARRHGPTSRGSLEHVVPWIAADSGGASELVATGVSFGAYHAANFALKRADLFPLAICQSGVYDVSLLGWGERGDASTSTTRCDYVAHLNGDHLDWLRGRVSARARLRPAVSGRTRRARSTAHSASRALLGGKGIRHELDVWGHDVPHDWPSWRAQLAHHLPRFCLMPSHLIGLLLGTEEDWPPPSRRSSRSSAPVELRGEDHEFRTERIVNEPFDLRSRPRYSLVIDRLGWWYDLAREWMKKCALMDDVYLLNNPFTFQSMEKHSAYCAMMRLGLKVPETWMVPHKVPAPTTRASSRQPCATTRPSISTRSAQRSAIRCT